MFYKSSAQDFSCIQQIMNQYNQANCLNNMLLIKIYQHIPFIESVNEKSAELELRNSVYADEFDLLNTFILIKNNQVSIISGSGTIFGDLKLLQIMLPFYKHSQKVQYILLQNTNNVNLQEVQISLYSAFYLDINFPLVYDKIETIISSQTQSLNSFASVLKFNVKNECIIHNLKNLSSQLLQELFQSQLLLQGVKFQKLQKVDQNQLQNGTLTYKSRPIETFDDIRLQANHLLKQQGEASLVILGTQHTRFQNAVTVDRNGVSNAFQSGGYYVDQSFEICQLVELFDKIE